MERNIAYFFYFRIEPKILFLNETLHAWQSFDDTAEATSRRETLHAWKSFDDTAEAISSRETLHAWQSFDIPAEAASRRETLYAWQSFDDTAEAISRRETLHAWQSFHNIGKFTHHVDCRREALEGYCNLDTSIEGKDGFESLRRTNLNFIFGNNEKRRNDCETFFKDLEKATNLR